MAEGADGAADALRRRLYAPGATDDDVARYRTAAEPDQAPEAPEPPRSGRPGPGLLGAACLLVAVAVAVTGIALGGGRAGVQTAAPTAVPTATPMATPMAVPTAAPVPVQTALPIAGSARAGFVRALEAGRTAGLLPYLLEHPDARPDAIRTVSRADSDEHRGVGAGTVALDPSALAARSGRMTVLIVVDDADGFAWRATRLAPTNDRSGPEVTLAGRSGPLQPGEVGTATITYRDGAPTGLLVLVRAGVRWGVVVVFTD